MSNPTPKAQFCSLRPRAQALPQPPPRRFALRESDFKTVDDSYVGASHSEHIDRHTYLMNTNTAYRVFHYISVIFGAHDERTPDPYRGGMTRIMNIIH